MEIGSRMWIRLQGYFNPAIWHVYIWGVMSHSNHLIRGKNRSANEEGKLEKVISSPHHSRVRKEMDPSVENNTFFEKRFPTSTSPWCRIVSTLRRCLDGRNLEKESDMGFWILITMFGFSMSGIWFLISESKGNQIPTQRGNEITPTPPVDYHFSFM